MDNGLKREFADLVRKYVADCAAPGADPEALLDEVAGQMDERAADFWYNSNC